MSTCLRASYKVIRFPLIHHRPTTHHHHLQHSILHTRYYFSWIIFVDTFRGYFSWILFVDLLFVDSFYGSTFHVYFWFDHQRLVNDWGFYLCAACQSPFQESWHTSWNIVFQLMFTQKDPWNPLNGGMHAHGSWQSRIIYAFCGKMAESFGKLLLCIHLSYLEKHCSLIGFAFLSVCQRLWGVLEWVGRLGNNKVPCSSEKRRCERISFWWYDSIESKSHGVTSVAQITGCIGIQ